MKVLYGIQGTGNGHLSRATFIYNLLKKLVHVMIVMVYFLLHLMELQ